jgi:hypothetical protein
MKEKFNSKFITDRKERYSINQIRVLKKLINNHFVLESELIKFYSGDQKDFGIGIKGLLLNDFPIRYRKINNIKIYWLEKK